MTINIDITARWEPLLHHALKIAALLYTTFIVLHDISDTHWSVNVTAWIVFALALVAMTAALTHMQSADQCRVCQRKPSADLKRWHYRAAATFGRLGGYALGAAVALWLTTYPLTFGKGGFLDRYQLDKGSPELNWLDVSAQLAVIYLFVAWISAAAFRRRHEGDPGLSTLASYLRTSGKRLTHKAHWFTIALCALLAALAFAPFDNKIVATAGMTATVGLFAAAQLSREHSMSLCEECVAEFRIDAAEHAARHSRRFTMAHRSGWIGIVAAAAMLSTLMFDRNLLGSILVSTFYLVTILTSLLWRFHSSYIPWCPLCRGGGGGEDEEELAPEPTGGHGRPVPVA